MGVVGLSLSTHHHGVCMHSGKVGKASSAISVLFGSTEQTAVGRALGEFRAGRPIMIGGSDTTGQLPLLAFPAEKLEGASLSAFRELAAPGQPRLVLSASRARAIGHDTLEPLGLDLQTNMNVSAIRALVETPCTTDRIEASNAGVLERAGIRLLKLAQLLPALLVAEIPPDRLPEISRLTIKVEASAIDGFLEELTQSLSLVSEAFVPFDTGRRARFVVFRDRLGETSTAIVVGKPDNARPVPVRVHSACLTGDVFGSRRCDCGDQLRLALAKLSEIGGGIVLYLPQEGRGLGLANKMRAYALQDTGLDTIDANTMLGFDDDERHYGIAARMLQLLGCKRILLLTNNPAKLEGIAGAGISVAGRIPLEAAINADNRRYMEAKAERAGHQFDAFSIEGDGNEKIPEPVV